MQHSAPEAREALSARASLCRLTTLLGLGILGAAIAVLPSVGDATVCVDDFVWIQIAHESDSLGQSLVHAWPSHLFFRPVDVMANWLVDPRTLVLSPLIVVQMLGLATLSAGVVALVRQCGGKSWRAQAAALAWLWMHPSTHLAVWSAGCSSQTWCAAAGVWGLNTLLRPPMPDSRRTWTLAAISTLGVLAKELFVGWATGLALATLVVSQGGSAKGARGSGLRGSLPAVLALLGPPALWVIVRWATSRLQDVTSTDATGLYALQGPVTVLRNAAVAALGLFVQGPVHWARLLRMPWSAIPFLGAGLSLGLAWLGAGAVRTHASVPLGKHALAACVALGLLAVWPALVIEHISELYLLGPNALVAVLVGLGIERVFHDSDLPWRACLRGAACALLLIGATGFVSRTHHFFTTWSQARRLREEVREIAVAQKERQQPLVVRIPPRLFSGPMHSKYCVPPAVAAALPQAWTTMRLGDPSLPPVTFIDGRDASVEWPDIILEIQGDLAPRTIW